MTGLMMYLVCVALVVVGSLSFIAALKIPGRFRMWLACLAASVPVLLGVWLFTSSGLKVQDFPRLLQRATADANQATQGFQEAQAARKELNRILQ